MCIFVSLLFFLSLCTQESKRVNKGTEFVSEMFEQFAEPLEFFWQVFFPKVLQLIVPSIPCMDVVVRMV